MTGLPRQMFELPLNAGLLTRGDNRAKPEPSVENLLNMEFDDEGGVRIRFPFGVTSTNIIGGGTITNARRFFENGTELVLFTDTALYTWVVQSNAWKLIGTHLAVATDEQQRFTSNDDQFFTDRAELNGVIFYTWQTAAGVYISAVDKVTGATVLSPTQPTGTTQQRPRLLALASKMLFFYVTSVPLASPAIGLYVTAIDPSNPAQTAWATPAALTSPVLSFSFLSAYDVVKIPGADTALWVSDMYGGTTSYTIGKVTAALGVTSVIKSRSTDQVPLAVAVTPDGVSAQVIRYVTSVLRGDLITVSTLADVFTNTAMSSSMGSPLGHITAAFRSVKASGQYRCYWFVSTSEGTSPGVACQTGWIDDSNAVSPGGNATFINGLGVASHGFDYGGNVYVWLAFGGLSEYTTGAGSPIQVPLGALQNTYFLYRDDGLLVAKSVDNVGGGLGSIAGMLPGVALVPGTAATYAWCGTERRVIPLGVKLGTLSVDTYSMRASRDVLFNFDDNRARRCARLGETLYISGGLILQYDGSQITEVGWQVFPWFLHAEKTTGGTEITDGSYGVKATYRWDNARGERDRSTTATTLTIAMSGGPQRMAITVTPLNVTRKVLPASALEIWRTANAGSNYFLSTGIDPSVTTGTNPYIANSIASSSQGMTDALLDAVLTVREAYPETGGVLEDLPPPSASIIAASDTRIFLGGVAGQPDTIWYSKYRTDGHVASFNDALTFSVPQDGGKITAIGTLEGGVVVWRENATYLFAGPGNDNTGAGSNYVLSKIISTTNGAESLEAVSYGDPGWFVFTSTGWYLLDKAFNYTYVGKAVYRYDSEPVLAAVMLTDRQQFRVVTPNRVLVLDTNVNQWAEWTISDGLDMLVDSSGASWYLTSTGPRQELTTWTGYAGTDYTLLYAAVETQWIKPDGKQQGRYVVDFVQLLGGYRSSCQFQMQIAKDYEMTAPSLPNWHTTRVWTPNTTIDGNALELRTAPSKKRCAAIKVRINIATGVGGPLTGPCARLTSLTGQFAVNPGTYAALSAAQKQ